MSRNDSNDRELLIDDENLDNNSNNISAFTVVKELFRLINGLERCLLIIGIASAVASSLAQPLICLLIGNLGQSFMNLTHELLNATDPDERQKALDLFMSSTIQYCLAYVYIGAYNFATVSIHSSCIRYVGECIIFRLRKTFIIRILKQDIAEFDRNSTGKFTVLLNENMERIREALTNKLGWTVHLFSECVISFALVFGINWQLALLASLISPFLLIGTIFLAKWMSEMYEKKSIENEKAGAIASQALSSIKTVMAFNGQYHELDKYRKIVEIRRWIAIKYKIYCGMLDGFQHFSFYVIEFFAYYYGTKYVYDGTLSGGDVMKVFYLVIFATSNLKEGGSHLSSIAMGIGAAKPIVRWLKKKPEIEIETKEGTKPSVLEGSITFRNVFFAYPSRPEINVLKNLSFSVEHGEKVAIVGASGAGKSSIVQLLLRHYNYHIGEIQVDDVNLRDFDLKYLRSKIGIVNQEPVLFNATIEENLLFAKPSATLSEIYHALKQANAYDFVMEFPLGVKTVVGERGTQLSGGQKQRIAIARALIKQPQILLLDEATSSLDSSSETLVQEAIDKACLDKTTVIIAHRLSTIRNCNRIFVMSNGEIIDIGSHEELMSKRGEYYEMVMAQSLTEAAEKSSDASTPIGLRRRRRTTSYEQSELLSQISQYSHATEDDRQEDDLTRLKTELEEEGAEKGTLLRLITCSRSVMFLIIAGFIVGGIHGFCMPALGVVTSKMIDAYSHSGEELLEMGYTWARLFLFVGIIDGSCWLILRIIFAFASENLDLKLQMDTFKHLLRLQCSYFDDQKHSSQRLATRLSTDSANVRCGIDVQLGHVCTMLVALIVGMSIAYVYGWKMALLTSATFPLNLWAENKLAHFLEGVTKKDMRALEAASRIAIESFENVKTVRAFSMENVVMERIDAILSIAHKSNRRRAWIQGTVFGLCRSMFCYLYALNYAYGAYLVFHGEMWPINVYMVLFSITLVMNNSSQATVYIPEYIKAIYSAGLIFKILAEQPEIDNLSEEGSRVDSKRDISLQNVEFSYPQRHNHIVLHDFSMIVPSGKTTALVGHSGCGKSTIVSLIERFYDPNRGIISIGDVPLADAEPRHLRSKMALVSQEPVLFGCSIRENIIYGLVEESSEIPTHRIEQAMELANIRSFVDTLPQGMDTLIGERGAQLSGGQKQRIAIARALIRDPDILLLDEATSALDRQNEMLVQEALNKASESRTTVIIAHRLSTIANAHQIVVIKEGSIVEFGSPQELLNRKGEYWKMVQRQTLLTFSD